MTPLPDPTADLHSAILQFIAITLILLVLLVVVSLIILRRRRSRLTALSGKDAPADLPDAWAEAGRRAQPYGRDGTEGAEERS